MTVISLKKHPWPFVFVYVGRPFAGLPGHPLANPFKIATEAERGPAVLRYQRWLPDQPDVERLLAEIRDDCEFGRAPLACWCCNWRLGEPIKVECHAIVIAQAIADRWPSTGGTW